MERSWDAAWKGSLCSGIADSARPAVEWSIPSQLLPFAHPLLCSVLHCEQLPTSFHSMLLSYWDYLPAGRQFALLKTNNWNREMVHLSLGEPWSLPERDRRMSRKGKEKDFSAPPKSGLCLSDFHPIIKGLLVIKTEPNEKSSLKCGCREKQKKFGCCGIYFG